MPERLVPGRLLNAPLQPLALLLHKAVALQQEEAERKSSGDRPLEEDPEYKSFVDRNLERLLRQGDLGVDQ